MSDVILPQASLFLGIIPALILLYISIKGYEGYYKDKLIFLTFVGGIIAGFISVIIETFASGIGVLFIVLFPMLEQLFKLVILNFSRFQNKKETTIYGLTLGLGFGSIFTPFSMITANVQSTEFLVLISIIIGSFGIILLHGATGVCIGFGITEGKIIKYFIIAILLHVPLTSIIFITTLFNIQYLQIGIIIYGVIIYWIVTKKIMTKILPSKRRERRKKSQKSG
jgi:hypothetical protein